MRFEARHKQANVADEGVIAPKLHRAKAETVFLEMPLDAVREGVALIARQNGGHKLHHAPIGVHPREGLAILRFPAAQQQAFRFGDQEHDPLLLSSLAGCHSVQAILKNSAGDFMAILVYGLSQSLDGYVDHMKLGPPPPASFHHFVELVRGVTGFIYGRRMYEIMRYWDEDSPDWDAQDNDFAAAWRSQPKWVVSHSLKSVGPNATLVADDFEKVMRELKAELSGEIHVGGPALAQSLTEAGLIDEYRLYLRPVVLGRGTPFFAGPAAAPPGG